MKTPPLAVLAFTVFLGTGAAADLTILPLGDSITAGNAHGGYRARMVADLTAAGHAVHLLGSQTMADTDEAAASLRPPHDGLHHEGHGGWRIDQLEQSLDQGTNIDAGGHGGYFLTGGHGTGRPALRPDVVCFLAGINDINQFIGPCEKAGKTMSAAEILPVLQRRVTALVTKIHALSPRSVLLVGTLIPYANGLLDEKITGATGSQRLLWAKEDGVTPEQELGVNHFVILYNRWLKQEFVPRQKARGLRIELVDLYPDFLLADGKVRGWGEKADDGYGDYGLHPNQAGYDLMGASWAKAIDTLVR